VSLLNLLKGISGEYEINRVLGASGVASYIICANSFVAWNMAAGRPFDVTAYCVAFPGGLSAVLLAIGGAVAIKDRNVEVARTVRDTGSAPGLAAPTGVQNVNVVNPPNDPANVQESKP
jgi:hypothetical protein